MVETVYGKLQGVDLGDHWMYLGVPFAKAPVGELRWKAPQEMEKYEGVINCDHFPFKACQTGHKTPPYDKDFYDDPKYDGVINEDCLYMNIWAPKECQNAPVAVWIHGGAFMGGSASEKEFDGSAYAKRGVIFISIQYRLGIFGFLAHPWLTREAGTSGNYGILDQIQALKWIQKNIGAFGGDAGNVTIFGQSAGAMSVQTLISSPLTDGLFHKAIMQSGGSYGCGLHRDMSLEEEEKYGQMIAEIMEVSSLEEMRALSTEQVLEAFGKSMGKLMPITKGLFFLPVNDGKVLDDDYYAIIDQNRLKKIPYMLGSTKDDILVTKEMKTREEKPLYKGTVAFAEKMEELGRPGAYVYYFTRDLPGNDFGAWHSAELWYMMGTMKRCWRPWTPEDLQLSEDMLDYWTNFIKNGNPNGSGLQEWPAYTHENPFVKELDIQ